MEGEGDDDGVTRGEGERQEKVPEEAVKDVVGEDVIANEEEAVNADPEATELPDGEEGPDVSNHSTPLPATPPPPPPSSQTTTIVKQEKGAKADEGPTSSSWAHHRKHFFILSSAGKPIYSRYGDEGRLSSFTGLIQAIMSFFVDDDDSVRCINAGIHRFVFSTQGPLYLLAISSSGESENQLRTQLHHLHTQILTILTSAQLTRIFKTRGNYDLRNLLSGTEHHLTNLTRAFPTDAGLALSSVLCLPVPGRVRALVTGALGGGGGGGQGLVGLVFGLMIAKGRLVALVRPKRFSLHPDDYHHLTNTLTSSPSAYKSGDTWTPICLPRFNPNAFLHAYVSFLTPEVCVVCVGTDKEGFWVGRGWREGVGEELENNGALAAIDTAVKAVPYSIVEAGIPVLRHFICVASTLGQYTEPAPAPPYTNPADWKRLLKTYHRAAEVMRRKGSGDTDAQTLFLASATEAVVCCRTPPYDIYAAFGPLVAKPAAMEALSALVKWIKGNHERLFVGGGGVWGGGAGGG